MRGIKRKREEPLSNTKTKKDVYSLIYSDTEDELFNDSGSDLSYEEESSSDDEDLDVKPLASASKPWSTKNDVKTIPFTKKNSFTGQPAGSDPIDYFYFFFEEDLLERICQYTNSQAERMFLSETTKPASRITAWREITVAELKIFLGLLFHMGTVSLVRLHDYWKRDRLFSFSIFADQMSRNRFLIIMKCLYFTAKADNEDPLYKIRELIDYFNNKMDACYYPGKELCLDEWMILRQGRLSFRQFYKNKRYKYGIKLYMLTEPDGLILRFNIDAGSVYKEVTAKSHAEKVVMQLLEGKLNCGHSIYMESYYNSVSLAKTLLENNTYCTGILRKDRKENPHEVVRAKLHEKENISRFRDHVHVGKWRNKRTITYISTEYRNRIIQVPASRGLFSQKPEAIAKYKQFMSSVDRQDKLLAYYPLERKMIRWYLKIAVHTFQLLFINSFKMFTKYSGNSKMTLYDYRIAVINALLPCKPMQIQGPPPKKRPGHKITRITEKSGGRTKRKTCRQCYKTKQRKDTTWHCLGCPNHPGLCVECFDSYHNAS